MTFVLLRIMDWRDSTKEKDSCRRSCDFLKACPSCSASAAISSAFARELSPTGAARRCRRILVVWGAVRKTVESAEWLRSLARFVDSLGRRNALGVDRLNRWIPKIPTTFVELANGPHSVGWSRKTLGMGRRRVVMAVRRLTMRVIISLSGWMAVTRASGHLKGAVSSFLMSTRSSTATGCCCNLLTLDGPAATSDILRTTLSRSVESADWSIASAFLVEYWYL